MSVYEEALRRLQQKYQGVSPSPEAADDPYRAATESFTKKYGIIPAQPLPTPSSVESAPAPETPKVEAPKMAPSKQSPYLLEQITAELTDIKPPTIQEIRAFQQSQKSSVADRMRLAGDIENGKVKIADLKPEEVPWDQLMARPGYTRVAALGIRDPKKAYDYLMQLQGKMTGTAEERQSLQPPSFAGGLAQGLASGIALGVPEVAPGRTTAESAGQFAGQVLGMIPGVAAAGATGGAALAGAAARAVPALRGAGAAARIATGVLQGIGTGATLAPAQEAIRAGLTGEFDAGEAARRAAETVATYGAFGGAYPVAQSVVGAAGRQIAQRAPSLAQVAQAVGEQVPVAAAVAEGVPAGAIAGFLVGVIQGGAKAVMDEEARGFIPFVQTVAQSTKEEMAEELVEAIAYGISRGLIRPTAADVQRAARAAKQAMGESTTQAEATTTETAPVQETVTPPPAPTAEPATQAETMQEQAQSKRAQRSEMLRQAMPGIDEAAVMQIVRDTDTASDADFAALVERMRAPQTEAQATEARATETEVVPEFEEGVLESEVRRQPEPETQDQPFGFTVNVGDTVTIEGRDGTFEVIDTSDPSLIRVRTQTGSVMPVGRSLVRPIERAATQVATAPTTESPVPAQTPATTTAEQTTIQATEPAPRVRLGKRTYTTANGNRFREVYITNPDGTETRVDVRVREGRKGAEVTRAADIRRMALEQYQQQRGATRAAVEQPDPAAQARDGEVQGFAGARPALPEVATKPLPLVKRRDIVKTLEKHFGRMKTGNVKSWFLGQFNKRTGVIRTRLAEDFPVQMHELGHKLDRDLGLALPRYDRELLALGEQTTPDSLKNDREYRRAEGVAEFLRLYLTNPTEAQQKAPGYYAAFEARLDANPDVRDALQEVREMTQRFLSQDPRDKILSAMSIGEQEARLPNTPTRLYARVVDQLAPLDKVVRSLGLRGKLKVDEDPYLVGVLARGWAGKPQTWIERGVTDENFNFISEPLNAILNDVDNLDDFRAYITAKRAKELIGRGFEVEKTLGVGITEADMDAVIARFDEKYGPIQQRLVRFQNYLVDELVKSGVLSQEGAEAMKRMNQDYIPFYRLMDENLGTFRIAGARKFADVGQPIKRIRGSGRTIIDPIESVVKNTYMLLNVATRNKVGRTFIEFVEKHGLEGQLAEKVSTPMRPVSFQLGQIENFLAENGIEVNPDDLQKVATIFTPTGRPNASRYELTIMRDGKREYWEVDPEIYRALLFLDEESTATWVKILGTPARILREGAVLSPEFLGSNPVRDQWTAFVNSEYGYVPFVDLLKGTFDTLGRTDLYYRFLASGGAQASLVSLDRKSIQDQVKGYLDELKARRGTGVERLGYIIKKTANPREVLRTLSEYSELGTRLGEYRRAVEKEGETREGFLRAALAARDVTLDFSRRGSQTQTINQLTAFFNAQLQGLDKTVRVFREHPVRSTVRSTLVFTLPTIILYLMNRNNPYWEEKDQWQKDLFFLIPLPWTADENGHARNFLYLPKGHALAHVFGSAVERVLRWIDKEDPTAFEGLGKRLLEDSLPGLPIPTALIPLIENMANYDFFTDMPVVPVREQRLDPQDQYNIYTSDFARVWGKWLGYSPRKIDNLISGYGGGLWKLLLGEVGGAVMRGVETIIEGQPGSVARPSRGLAGVPFVKAFARDAAGPGVGSSVDQFYSELDRAESINRRVKRAAEQGKKPELTDEEKVLLARIGSLRKVDRTLQDLRAARRAIENDPNMTGDEKREAINALEMLMTNVARVTLGKHPIEVPVE